MCHENFQVPLKLLQNVLFAKMLHGIFPGCATEGKTQITIFNQLQNCGV